MALRGNLRDFSLPDVFQLVQLSKKTGVLRIRGPQAEGSVWFRDGDVFFAQSNWHRDLLGDRLVKAGRITPSALAKALEIRAREGANGRRLGQILVDEGYITHSVLEAFVQEQIQDTIFDLMRWDEGEFDFEILPEVIDEDIGLSVSIENIVMEGSRRLEEWNRIKKKVPSMDMVFKMATAPGEGTFEISLKPSEWNLLLLVDGTRTVSQLASELGKTDFEVARIIYGLFSAGLLEVASEGEVERLRAERAEREARRAATAAAAASAAPPVPAPSGLEVPVPTAVPQAGEAPQRAEEPAGAPSVVTPAREPETESERSLAAPEVEAMEQHAPAAPVEVPEFLAQQAAAPSAEDMAVFEQMMEAVLAPGEQVRSPSTAPVEPETPVVPELAVEPTVETQAVAAPEEPAAPEGSYTEGFGAITPSEVAEIPVPPVVEEIEVQAPAPVAGFTPTGDLEADLRALGLGELPVEAVTLEQPESAEEQAVADEVVPAVAPEAVIPPEHSWPEEAELPVAEPMSEVELAAEEQQPQAGDLGALLRSLSLEEEAGGAPETPAEPVQVISTDAYLAEFDVGLSSGLSDEIAALTGAETPRARPSTTVERLPEPGERHVIHRDRMVDRDLVMRIIEGIQKL